MTRYLTPSVGEMNPTFDQTAVTTREVECVDLRDALLSEMPFFHVESTNGRGYVYSKKDNSIQIIDLQYTGPEENRYPSRHYLIREVFKASDLLSKDTNYVVVN